MIMYIMVLVCQCGVEAARLGVITPLRNQELLIKQHLQEEVFTTAYQSHLALFSSPSRSQSVSSSPLPKPQPSPPQSPLTQLSSILLYQPPRILVEVSTVDKYQGRDKDCIIMSFARSNQEGNVSALSYYVHGTPLVLWLKASLT